jgi:serine/threonine-protein kinase
MAEGAAGRITVGEVRPECVRLNGRYRLVEKAGTGGMAVVWRAFDEVLNRRVAIKVLTPQASSDPQLVRRLHAEAQAVAQLSHPHITAVHDYGQDIADDGATQPYVVMELVEGVTLQDCLADDQGMAWPQAVTIVAQVASALAAAHSHGIVHRDVTTSNVMLTPAGVKVLDFGISALLGEHDCAAGDSLLGTPAHRRMSRRSGSARRLSR